MDTMGLLSDFTTDGAYLGFYRLELLVTMR